MWFWIAAYWGGVVLLAVMIIAAIIRDIAGIGRQERVGTRSDSDDRGRISDEERDDGNAQSARG